MKTITFDYDFHNTYYFNKMISIPKIVKCLYCEKGKHKRIGDGKIVDCPVCEGKGDIDTKSGSLKEEPRKCFLYKISTETTKEEDYVNYMFIDEDNKTVHANIYDDIDECIKNQGKGIMGYSPC